MNSADGEDVPGNSEERTLTRVDEAVPVDGRLDVRIARHKLHAFLEAPQAAILEQVHT